MQQKISTRRRAVLFFHIFSVFVSVFLGYIKKKVIIKKYSDGENSIRNMHVTGIRRVLVEWKALPEISG